MVNRLRNDLFSAKKGEVESHQLPPCKDYFVKHKQRANYQVAVGRKCLHQDPEIPRPVDRGSKMETENGRAVGDPLDGWSASTSDHLSLQL